MNVVGDPEDFGGDFLLNGAVRAEGIGSIYFFFRDIHLAYFLIL